MGTLATFTRDDGSQQVTYNGMALYLYQSDAAPGDTTGQGVGNNWFVVAP
jgi:predicted lipoprotein with Yx(FWY)xxD motif